MASLFFETYGCQMNLAEADSLKSDAVRRGHTVLNTHENADFVIINTCSVRETAEARIAGRLGFFRAYNNASSRPLSVILMGCMSENVGMEMQKRFSDIVKIVWGTYAKDEVFNYMDDLQAAHSHLGFGTAYSFMPAKPSKETPFKAFLPVAHGCNKFCSYCIVPHVRGKEQNRPFEDVIENAKQLESEGVLELCLLAQTIDTYRWQGKRLPDLLDALATKTSIPRITFLTAHPREFLIETAQLMNTHKSIISYLHLPFQSGSDRILSLMKRGYTNEQYRQKIDDVLKACPGISLSTDILTGFPTESDEDFNDTFKLFTDIGYSEAFIYRYNTRPNTPAEHYDNQVPEDIKLKRVDVLVKAHRANLAKQMEKRVGQTTEVLFDRESKHSLQNPDASPKQFLGRTRHNVVCAVHSTENLIGKILPVSITSSQEALVEGTLL